MSCMMADRRQALSGRGMLMHTEDRRGNAIAFISAIAICSTPAHSLIVHLPSYFCILFILRGGLGRCFGFAESGKLILTSI
jgi:hypothetical protein